MHSLSTEDKAVENKNLKVLVIDDKGLAGMYGAIVSLGGYEVTVHEGFDSARQQVEGGESFDLVLASGGAFGKGIHFIKWINKTNPTLPIVCMTGDAVCYIKNENPEVNAVTFLELPFGPVELCDVLKLVFAGEKNCGILREKDGVKCGDKLRHFCAHHSPK